MFYIFARVFDKYLNISSVTRFFSTSVLVIALFSGCSDEELKPIDKLSPYQKEVLDYFTDVALGFEFGSALQVTRKWQREIKVFVGGDKTTEMMTELDEIIAELESLSDQLDISITADTLQSNFYIYLGTGSGFVERFPPAQQHVASNWGLFYVYFTGANEMTGAVMYVDLVRTTQAEARRHLLREEFTQALGLARDSNLYPESIFYSPWTTTTEYAPIDRDLIRLLYHPDVATGLDESAVRAQLPDIILELNIGS